MADILQAVAEICRERQITALDPLLESCRTFAAEEVLNVAIFGRFKAGKSSFLNHLLGRPLLPVGAIPVTTAVTEIEYGPEECAVVVFKDGSTEQIAVERIGAFISEAENPENAKQVVRVRAALPWMAPGMRFVDTPGLESVLEHNTEASLDWLPNVGLALVAVGVDPPLSQHDIELIRNLGRYTPNISLLLTKIDLLEESERPQVEEFVHRQLARYWDRPVPVYPYSTRPGFEALRTRLREELLSRVRADAGEHHRTILRHKLDSLAGECAAYLALAWKAAERDDAERQRLQASILGEKEYLEDSRQALRLIARHAAVRARTSFEEILATGAPALRERLLAEFRQEFPAWTRSLSVASQRFQAWLESAVTREMSHLSRTHREQFVEPIRSVSRQLSQALQDFRNRLSARTITALGVPLRTTEMELQVPVPHAPDVRVGKIFDRNWEMISLVLPMPLIGRVLKRHFERKVADVVWMNLSRLATQWAEIVTGCLSGLEKEAIHRLEDLVVTIEKLIASAGQDAPRIRADLNKLEDLRAGLRGVTDSPGEVRR
jgi:GTP-binding protein EngB required for normal cell division